MTLFFYYNKSMEKQLTIIFDVDGTIADVEHRRHLVNGDKGFKPDWNAFRLLLQTILQ